MSDTISNVRVLQEDGSFLETTLSMKDGYFTECSSGEDFNGKGLIAIPGLIDLHFHGCVGYDFCDGTVEAFEAIAQYQSMNGTTAICPATMTFPEAKLAGILSAAKDYVPGDFSAALVGVNMEGPFLSLAKKGAQNGAYLQKPDADMFRRLQTASGNLVKLLAVAPEEEGALELIKEVSNEVTLSLAHTTADYETGKKAFDCGARQLTHLYNAMPGFSHREPGVIGAGIDCKDCNAELICDGVHIHPSVVRATFSMFSKDRVILISDSMMATGLPNGEYSLGGQKVTVEGKKCTLEDGTIAGSATNLFSCMQIAVKEMKIPLADAVFAASKNPAKALGLYNERGSIEVGKIADVLLVDEELNLKHVFLRGKRIK